MIWKDAQAIIKEAKSLGYKGTDWEKGLIARLEAMEPATLTAADAQSLVIYYRRASGGTNYERRQIIGKRGRYNED